MLLKLPDTKITIQLTENGAAYTLDTANIAAMRELSGLADAALKTISGDAWAEGQGERVIREAEKAINAALGEGAYGLLCGEAPSIKDNPVLLLSICGQLGHLAHEAIAKHIGQYKQDGMGAFKEIAASAKDIVAAMNALHADPSGGAD